MNRLCKCLGFLKKQLGLQDAFDTFQLEEWSWGTLSFVPNIIVHGLYCVAPFMCKQEEGILGKSCYHGIKSEEVPCCLGSDAWVSWALVPTGYHGMLTVG